MKEEPDLKERRSIFKRWLIEQICSPDSGTLTLEYKLYAVRRPAIREKWLDLYNALFTGDEGLSIELLFGDKQPRAARIEIEQRFAVLGGALTALILERQFRPTLLLPNHLRKFAEEMFDALVPTQL